MMKNIKQWIRNDDSFLEVEYLISDGCCLFHDGEEQSNFTDINDDELEE